MRLLLRFLFRCLAFPAVVPAFAAFVVAATAAMVALGFVAVFIFFVGAMGESFVYIYACVNARCPRLSFPIVATRKIEYCPDCKFPVRFKRTMRKEDYERQGVA